MVTAEDPFAILDEWRTSTVCAIAKNLYEATNGDVGFFSLLADALQDTGCEKDYLLHVCRNPQELNYRHHTILANILKQSPLSPLLWWQFYQLMGLGTEYQKDVSKLDISPSSVCWNIPVIKGVNFTTENLEKVGIFLWDPIENFNQTAIRNDRTFAMGSYVIGIRSDLEADDEYRNLSAQDLNFTLFTSIQLNECLILEGGYFLATNHPLDAQTATLCLGSSDSDGRVVGTNWTPEGQLYIHWLDRDWRHPQWRTRLVYENFDE